ncbi:MAG: precorrin-6y C5,15-methyltransferase (decarboxylating) subunit CbiE [Acidimicrobiales bacterium]
MREPRSIAVVGMFGGAPSGPASAAIEGADLLVGGRHHLDTVPEAGDRRARRLPLEADLAGALDAIEVESGRVCVLASGDPGFFGIVRVLAERFGPGALDVHPAPSSVAVAFARLGLPWDDAVVVSAHGRPLSDAARQAVGAAKAAVLTSPDSPPEALAKELQQLGSRQEAVVCSHLGEAGEALRAVDLDGLAAGTWDPRSVVVLLAPDAGAVSPAKVLAWGRPEDRFGHRAGLITKAEVRAVALGKLALPATGVLWDIGSGSGSVAVECATLAPGLRVIAVEQDPEACMRIRANANGHGAGVEVVEGVAPDALSNLPDPNRVFVGGGGLAVLDAARARLRPGGRMVATFAAMDRAAAAFDRLGHLSQVSVSRGETLPGGGLRLVGANPVFVVWGPDE